MRFLPPFQPRDDAEIVDFLRARSVEPEQSIRIQGGGGKAAFGNPPETDCAVLDLSRLSGITLYQPGELVLTAQAGTTLDEIAAAVAEQGQCLGFEPPEYGALFGTAGRRSTLGGCVASGWSGPRRVKAGAVRDHVLGARAVGGDGQVFQSGGRVVKNVTGFDLPKLLTGSHGTLAAMTEITIKISPAPETSRTLVLLGLDDAMAIGFLCDALGGPYDIAGAAHLPIAAAARSAIGDIVRSGAAATLLRIEGFGPSVADRFAALESRFAGACSHLTLDADAGRVLWGKVCDLESLIDPAAIVWRLSLPASEAASTVAAIENKIAPAGAMEAVYDWGGGLVWLSVTGPGPNDAHATTIRDLLPAGHAVLMRAPEDIRARSAIFQPQPPALAALTRRVKAAFDPAGLLPRHIREA